MASGKRKKIKTKQHIYTFVENSVSNQREMCELRDMAQLVACTAEESLRLSGLGYLAFCPWPH